ncbi:MAG: hypothetical protein IJ705_01415 [Oscillospiraceae bacterium]|nr:hypothetical protein [Oscillospiraceae bacterium]
MWKKTKAELAKMRGMGFGEAVDYFFTYYKIHLLVFALGVFFLVLICQAFFGKRQELVFSAMLVNTGIPQETADAVGRAFFSREGLDGETQRVILDAGITGAGGTGRADVAGLQKLLVSIAAGEVDAVLTGEDVTDYLLKGGALSDLQTVLGEEALGQYQNRLIYADAAALGAWVEANRAGTADSAPLISADPAGMAEPVPVGVDVTEACETVFGRPAEGGPLILSVAVTTRRQAECGRFLDYLEGSAA